MKTPNKQIITAGNMATDVLSSAILVDQIFGIALHCIYTGAPVGTLKLQASCDDVFQPDDVVNWIDITGASVAVSVAGATLFNVSDVYYKWFRVFYDATSGSGSLTVNYCAKGA